MTVVALNKFWLRKWAVTCLIFLDIYTIVMCDKGILTLFFTDFWRTRSQNRVKTYLWIKNYLYDTEKQLFRVSYTSYTQKRNSYAFAFVFFTHISWNRFKAMKYANWHDFRTNTPTCHEITSYHHNHKNSFSFKLNTLFSLPKNNKMYLFNKKMGLFHEILWWHYI